MILRLAPITTLAICAVALGAQIRAATATSSATRTVTLRDIAFSPAKLTVRKGTRVKFAFRDDGTAHNVVSSAGRRFTSIPVKSSGSATRRFSLAGTYRYSCTLHPGMTGRIVVR